MYSNKKNFVWSNVPRIVVNLSSAYEHLENSKAVRQSSARVQFDQEDISMTFVRSSSRATVDITVNGIRFIRSRVLMPAVSMAN